MAIHLYRPGDLILCHSPGWLPAAIRWATRRRGEPITYANHTAGFVDSETIVEALWKVERKPYRGSMPEPHQVWRRKDLTPTERLKVALCAEQYVGRQYGVLKLFAHLGDAVLEKLFGRDVYIVRRLAFLDRYPICSWVWAWAYDKALNIRFRGLHPRFVTPDDMWDHVRENPGWVKVSETGKWAG